MRSFVLVVAIGVFLMTHGYCAAPSGQGRSGDGAAKNVSGERRTRREDVPRTFVRPVTAPHAGKPPAIVRPPAERSPTPVTPKPTMAASASSDGRQRHANSTVLGGPASPNANSGLKGSALRSH